MKKIIALIFILIFALSMSFACSTPAPESSSNYDNSASQESASQDTAQDTAENGEEQTVEGTADGSGIGDLSGNVTTTDGSRKLVYNANYEIQTTDYDGDYGKIVSATKKYNGYFSFEDTHGTKPEEFGDPGRTSILTIRIPVENYTAFTEELSSVGEVIQKSQNTEDITGSYTDVESRISLLETQYDKLDAHLKQATKMSDIIELEEEMSKILNELDELRGTIRDYDDMVYYTTIDVSLREVVKSSEVSTSKEGFWDRASSGFNSTLKSVGVFFESLGVFLISAAPVLIILAIIAVAVIIIVRSCTKKRRASKKSSAAYEGPMISAQGEATNEPANTNSQDNQLNQ